MQAVVSATSGAVVSALLDALVGIPGDVDVALERASTPFAAVNTSHSAPPTRELQPLPHESIVR